MQSSKASMGYQLDETYIREGKILLYRRNDLPSKTYQCRFNLGGKQIRRSTKEANLEKAKIAAGEIYDEVRWRHKEGLPITQITFNALWPDFVKAKDGYWQAARRANYETKFKSYFSL